MKRLLIILFCLPLLFACQKEEIFEEGQEVVLNLSVDMGDMQSAATRAMGDNVEGTPALWLAVFDGEGYLVEWTKAFDFTQADGVTNFKAKLHATMEKRVMHFLLNYVDDSEELEFDYGHENNVIGSLKVERDRDVYWQRVELPEGINGSTDQNGTVKKYLTKVPLVRNFSKITVSVAEECKGFVLDGLTDSKKLSKKKREFYFEEIKKQAISYGIGIIDEKKIDEVNIYEATKLAMKEAIDNCHIKPEHVLIDAMPLEIDIPTTSIIKGDLKSITISAASVIAKVTRDRMLMELDEKYPMYEFKKNKGYPTKKHLEAIKEYGIIDEHRRSYGPVKEYLENNK